MLVKPLQPLNAELPIEAMVLGMIMLVKSLRFSNAELPISSTMYLLTERAGIAASPPFPTYFTIFTEYLSAYELASAFLIIRSY